MSLGTMLATTLQNDAYAVVNREAARLAAIQARKDALRKSRVNMLDRFYERIESAITEGKVPAVKVKTYTNRQWIQNAFDRKTEEDVDVMRAFELRLIDEGLDLVLSEEHDGMGIESWLVIRVKPI